MAEISDSQVVTFANQKVRRHANQMYSCWRNAKDIILEYNAGDIGTKINNANPAELVADGSARDGRTRLTGGDIFNYITMLQQFERFIENLSVVTADRTTVVAKAANERTL